MSTCRTNPPNNVIRSSCRSHIATDAINNAFDSRFNEYEKFIEQTVYLPCFHANFMTVGLRFSNSKLRSDLLRTIILHRQFKAHFNWNICLTLAICIRSEISWMEIGIETSSRAYKEKKKQERATAKSHKSFNESAYKEKEPFHAQPEETGNREESKRHAAAQFITLRYRAACTLLQQQQICKRKSNPLSNWRLIER